METNTLLYIALIIYLMVMIFGYIFKLKWLYFIGGLLWFIPILEIDNTFIVLISATMILAHGILGFTKEKGDDFEWTQQHI